MSEKFENYTSQFEANIQANVWKYIEMPETLKLLNWKNNLDSQLFEQELNEIEAKMIDNMKKNWIDDSLFQKCADNTFELTDNMRILIIDRYIDFIKILKQHVNLQDLENGNSNDLYLSTILNDITKTPLEKLLSWVINNDEHRVFEIKLGSIKKRYIIWNDTDYVELLSNIVIDIKSSGANNDDDVEMKLIPQILMWIDGYFLSNSDYHHHIKTLRKIGITMESSKQFLDEYMKNEKIDSYSDIDLFKIVSKQTLVYIFWDKIEKLESLWNFTVFDCIKLYKLKEMWWELNFIQWISNMIDAWILNYRTIHGIENIIESNVNFQELPDYIELSKCITDDSVNFFKKQWFATHHKKEYVFPDLQWYTPKKYYEIVKYMQSYNIPYIEYSKNIEQCEILYNNKIHWEAYRFLPQNNLLWNIFNDETTRLRELFENENWGELFLFLSKYPQTLKNLWWQVIDEIWLTTEPNWYNFCFRGILEMIKSRQDIKTYKIDEVDEETRKKSREKIVKEYENILRNYISLDKDNNWNRIPQNETFDKIFYYNADNDEDWNWALQWNMDTILESFTDNFENCSDISQSDSEITKNNMIDEIKKYATQHQNEKILVYVWTHWWENWDSWNWRTKDDRWNLAKISQNIKIMSPRCYFWAAYNNTIINDENYVYSLQSPVSWFSNNTSTYATYWNNAIKEWYDLNLWFHELEIYTRLKYDESFSPLTDFVDYTDFNTWKKKHWKIWLADAWINTQSEIDAYYW